jgi:hypothetical protein
MQQIDLERREKKFDNADKMYTKLMKQIPTKHDKYKNMKTWIAMKYARFQFKICNDVDKVTYALLVLFMHLKIILKIIYVLPRFR